MAGTPRCDLLPRLVLACVCFGPVPQARAFSLEPLLPTSFLLSCGAVGGQVRARCMRRGEPLKGFGFGVLESYWTLACVWPTCLVWRALAGLSMTGSHPKLTAQASAPHEAFAKLYKFASVAVQNRMRGLARGARPYVRQPRSSTTQPSIRQGRQGSSDTQIHKSS